MLRRLSVLLWLSVSAAPAASAFVSRTTSTTAPSSASVAFASKRVCTAAPSAFRQQPPSSWALFSEPPEKDDEEGLDLNLEEMFDMFESAEQGEDFDDALEKVKGGSGGEE